MDVDVGFSTVLAAARRLAGVVLLTPVITNRQLDALIAGHVFLKCESFQRTGSFKFRGAYSALSYLKTAHGLAKVATISSGNHGQGVALAAGLLGGSAYVVMPQPVSALKQRAVVGYGGQVILAENRQSADEIIERILATEGATYVHAFNDVQVIAGQGTVMLELLGQVQTLDVILAPVGGGGLLSGICIAGHHLRPSLQIFGCEPEGALDAEQSIRLNRIVPMPAPKTLADGLRTSLGSRTLPILREHLTGILRVTEAEITTAMRFAHQRLNLVIEPSSAVALAPILREESVLRGQRVGVIVTGGNVDLEDL